MTLILHIFPMHNFIYYLYRFISKELQVFEIL